MKYKDIQIDQDLKHERTSWKVQKTAVIVFIIILVLVLLGFAGTGPFSKSKIEHYGSKLEYSSITRFGHPEEMIIEPASVDSLSIQIDKEFLKKISITRIVPEPETQTYNDQYIVFNFTSVPGTKPLVIIDYEFRESGNIKGTMTINNNSFNFSTFVWP